jgi:hypothetical protein
VTPPGEQKDAGKARRARRRQSEPAVARRRRARPPRILIVLALLAPLAAGVGYWLFTRRPPRALPPVAQTLASEPADPGVLFRRVRALSGEHRWVEALPLARQLVEHDETFWQSHHLYAFTLSAAIHQERIVRGKPFPVTRSSRELVAMLRQAMIELETAGRLTKDKEHLIHVHSLLGQTLAVWGFDWNALMEYEALARIDPAWKDKVEETEEAAKVVARLLLANQVNAPR